LNGKPYYTWKRNKQDKTWYTVPVKEASNDLLGVIEGKDQFNFTYKVTLPEISGEAKIWLPIAQSDDFQTIELLSQEAPGIQEVIQDPEYGNSIWYLELTPEHSKQKITLNYRVERIEKTAYREQSPNLQKYLEASSLMPVGDRFSTIASQVIRERQADTPLTKARALYDYIIDNMRYAKEGIYGTGDANYACDSKSGNCTEFHSFFISLARSAGIPARFAVGAAIPSERNEGGVDGYHCWAEFYAEDKWWPVDISEGNKYTALATYYFGHHPANRIEFSRGRDLDPEPLPASGPINFLAYPVMEIDGKPAYPQTSFTFSRGTTGS
jgi:transglutaminase-like putative cysteine protease